MKIRVLVGVRLHVVELDENDSSFSSGFAVPENLYAPAKVSFQGVGQRQDADSKRGSDADMFDRQSQPRGISHVRVRDNLLQHSLGGYARTKISRGKGQ